MPKIFVTISLFVSLSLSAKDFSIIDFGAVGDGVTMNTVFIQNAIDSAHAFGKSRVVVPEGTFLFGSIDLKSNVELHLERGAILLGSPIHEDYRKIESSYQRGFILASYQENIAITGEGTIDGQGRAAALYLDSLYHLGQLPEKRYNNVEKRPKFYMRPMLVLFVGCKNVIIEDITLLNSGSWIQHYDRCENLRITGIHVYSDAYWNNDGLDISDCKNVTVRNCYIDAADDGICLKSHFVDEYMDNVHISDCVVRSSASAVKFGTKSEGGFKNVTIKNIKVFDTYRSAIAIESVDGGFLENIVVDSIRAVNTGNAIFIKLGQREVDRKKSTLKNVVLRNIQVEVAYERPDYAYDIRGPSLPFFHNTFPSSITGMPGHYVENVILENISIHYPGKGNKGMAYSPLSRLDNVPENEADYPEFSMFGELPAWGFYVRHVKGIKFKDVTVRIEDPDYRPAFVFDDVQNVKMESINIEGDSKEDLIILHKTNNVEIDNDNAVRKM